MYKTYRKENGIKLIIKNSGFFRAVLNKDGSAYLFPSSKNIESMVDRSDALFDNSCKVHLPHSNIEHLSINGREFVYINRNSDGKQELYHGIVDEQSADEEQKLEAMIPQTTYYYYKPEKIAIKSIYGPL